MIIGKYEKQPAEVLDYACDLTQWLPRGDLAVSATTTVVPVGELAIESTVIADAGRTIRVWLSGGVDGTQYKVQVRFVTDQSRTKEYEFLVRLREV